MLKRLGPPPPLLSLTAPTTRQRLYVEDVALSWRKGLDRVSSNEAARVATAQPGSRGFGGGLGGELPF